MWQKEREEEQWNGQNLKKLKYHFEAEVRRAVSEE